MIKMNKSKRYTIKDVSQLANVSISTVSRVLNRPSLVSEKTARRVRSVIDQLEYIPNPSARALAGGKTNMLGLVIPEISARSLLTLLAGIEATADERGYGLLIYSTARQSIHSDKLLKALGPHNIDGLLVYVQCLEDATLKHLHEINFPLVLLHQAPPKNVHIPYITFENQASVKLLIDHLIEVHNYHRIAFLRGPEGHSDSLLREKGYRDSLNEHGIAIDQRIIGYGGFNIKQAETTITAWLNKGVKFDAIFAGADEAAIGAILALQKTNLRVPEDIAVVGFDDIDFGYGYHISPSLTTIHADFEEAGRQATIILTKLIRKEKTVNKIILPANPVYRQSCGCHSTE